VDTESCIDEPNLDEVISEAQAARAT